MKIDKFIDNLIIKKKINKVIVDLHRISYIDSSGIGILVVCKKKLDLVNGCLKIVNVNDQVKKVFTTLNIDKIIEIEDNSELTPNTVNSI